MFLHLTFHDLNTFKNTNIALVIRIKIDKKRKRLNEHLLRHLYYFLLAVLIFV